MRSRAWRSSGRLSITMLLVAVLAAAVSLGSVIQAYAMPVEARTTEPWYAYQSAVGFDFVARVQPSKFYSTDLVRSGDLIQMKGPVEPPTYRRVLISRFTDDIDFTVTYRFQADRSAPLKVTMRIDGTTTLPGLWQRHYRFLEPKTVELEGTTTEGSGTFKIPVAQLLKDMEENRQMNLAAEPMEITIRPVLEVQALGLREPVAVSNAGEFRVVIRSNTVEIDDAREVTAEKNFAETKVVPLRASLLGLEVTVAALRQITMLLLVLFLVTVGLLVWLRRGRPTEKGLLQRLGPNLIAARAFETPGEAAVVDVRSARELLQLQTQSERPVIRVGTDYYLQDGTTCYRLTLATEEVAG